VIIGMFMIRSALEEELWDFEFARRYFPPKEVSYFPPIEVGSSKHSI